MRTIIFVAIFLALLIGFCVYLEVDTQKFVDNLPAIPTSKDNPQSAEPRKSASEVANPVVSDVKLVSENKEQNMPLANKDVSVTPAWLDQQEPDWRKKSSDPFADYLTEQDAKERGTLITADMTGEELWNAELNQMIEQFGDIEEVHTIMKYTRMAALNIPIPLDNEIEFQEALNTIYPSDTNRKTLAFLKWQYSRGDSPEDLGDITDADVAELRSMDISVRQELTDTGFRTIISTE